MAQRPCVPLGVEQVTSVARAQLPDTLELLADLIGINTHADNAVGLQACRDRLKRPLGELGFGVEEIPVSIALSRPEGGSLSRTHLRAFRPGRSREACRILVLGHLDTVYAPDDRFELRRGDERWCGPGASDMKGGIATAMLTLQLLHRFERLDDADWSVLLVSDEEQGSPTGKALLQAAGMQADVALSFEAARPCGGLVIARKGVQAARIVARGRTGHAGIDHAKAINALSMLAEFLVQVERLSGDGVTVSAGGSIDVQPRSVNTVPSLATCEVEWRYPDPARGERVRHELRRLAAEIGTSRGGEIELQWDEETPPMPASHLSEPLVGCYREAAGQLGMRIDGVATAGAGDINVVAGAGVVCLDGVGPEGGGFHSEAEFVLVDSIARRAAMNALAITRYLERASPKAHA